MRLTPDPRLWDLRTYVDPARAADIAPAFWTETSRYTLAVTCASAPSHHPHALDLRDARCDVHILKPGDGHEHILLLDEGRRLQMDLVGVPAVGRILLSPVAGQIDSGATRRQQLRHALDHFVLHRRLPKRLYRGDAGSQRLLFILLAMDSARAGASVDEQARLLFGAARLQQVGRKHMRALRAQIDRAVARGEWLSAEGYRTLLI